jgi:hypothetical protein
MTFFFVNFAWNVCFQICRVRQYLENATHNTFERKPGHGGDKYPAFPVLWVAFSIPPGSLSLVKYPV